MFLPSNETLLNHHTSASHNISTDNCIKLFEEQVENKPLDVALVYKEAKINFYTLNVKANQVAYFLLSKGVKPEVRVPICVERNVEMIVWILGILKAGGAYVPIDPESPANRITYLLNDLDASMLITNKAVKSKLAVKEDIALIDVEETLSYVQNSPTTNLDVSIQPDQLAYIIYTSGSTGKPKGVMIEHHSLANYLLYCKTNYISDKEVGSGSFMHLSYTFDASLTAMFLPLITGKSVVIGSKSSLETFEDENFWKYAPYDFIKATPAHLELLAETIIDRNNEWVTKKLVLGGEALYLNYLKPFIERGVDLNIVNEYGPTEATVGCTTYFFNTLTDTAKVDQKVSIGKPIEGFQLHIINVLGELAAVGQEGEICISGAGLARGYLNRPDLTTAKFVEKFIQPYNLVRLYRTGDLGRWLPDGNIEYNGRIDDQIKISGYRIEPGEIESVLLQNPDISQAVVAAKKDEQGNNKLVAYVMSYSAWLHKQQIFLYLKERLPEFMIPAEVVVLARFPLTKNGKVDRVSLLEIKEIRKPKEEDFKEPSNETEEILANIWMEILGIKRVSINDNFFEIGGSSLLAVKMFSKIRKAWGIKLSLGLLHHAKTIEKIAAIVINKAHDKHFSCLVPIQPKGSKVPLFCVHGGWGHVLFYDGLADQLGSDQPLYGLQVRGLNGLDAPFHKLEDMAAYYLQEIRQVQPVGPYQLAGYCYGAIVAFEMANQLIQNNEEVELLVNFNGPSTSHILDKGKENSTDENINFRKKKRTISGKVKSIAGSLSKKIKHFSRLNAKQKLLYPLKEINRMYWSSKIRISISNANFRVICKCYIKLKKVMPDTILKRYIVQSMATALSQYRAKAYRGKMIIFRSPCLYKDPSLGWTNLIEGGITTFDVQGEHGVGNAIFQKPYVQSVADQLKKYLH